MDRLKLLVPNYPGPFNGNPSLVLLYADLEKVSGIKAEPYSTRAVLQSRWDVIHVHWPEWMVNREGSAASLAVSCARVLAELAFAKKRGAKIVWTAHNIKPHEVDSWGILAIYLRAFTGLVDQVVAPTPNALDPILRQYPSIAEVDQRVIPTGLFDGYYHDSNCTQQEARDALDLPQEGTIFLSLGRIRSYKNIPHLMGEFAKLNRRAESKIFLLVAGAPTPERLGHEVASAAQSLDNVRVDLGRIDPDRIHLYLRACDFVVIATSFALNSAVLKLSLSFNRPVIAPRRGSAIELSEEFGDDWVRLYEGEICSAILSQVLQSGACVGTVPTAASFTWNAAAMKTAEAYGHICTTTSHSRVG